MSSREGTPEPTSIKKDIKVKKTFSIYNDQKNKPQVFI
jgi:hypothetical protein